MARPRKNEPKPNTQELALVPVEEQPYPLPEGWKWVRLGSMAEIISKGTTPKGGKDAYEPSGVAFLRVENINEDGTISHENIVYVSTEQHTNFLKRSILEDGDVLISIAGTLGRTGIVRSIDLPMNTNQAVSFVRLRKGFSNRYIRYFVNSPASQQLLLAQTKVTSIPNLTLEIINNCPVPLPPLDVQERIVAHIEFLFAKLDEAKEKAEAVLDSYETRKAAILHKAFTGELTAKWREERGVPKSDWKSVPFCQVAEVKSNLVDPADFQDLPHIAPDNIEKKTGRLLEYRTIAEDKVTSGKHRFYPGQILYSKIRPYLSKVVVIDFDGLCSADMYPIEAKEDTKYLWYYMLSEDFLEQASSAGSRSVLPKINQKELSRITIHRPNLPEQQEITRILDSLLEKEQQSKAAAEAVLEQIDLMKKAILAKAFRGELG